MAASSTPGSASRDPRRARRRRGLAALAVVAVLAAVVASGTLGLLISRAPGPGSAPAATADASRPASSDVANRDPHAGPGQIIADASPTAPSADVPWSAIGELPPLQPVASLAPTIEDAAGIAPGAAFTLTSLGGLPASTLVAGLNVEPAIELRAVPGGADGRTATVRPTRPLEPGQRYRFDLRTADDALVGSWVFKVKQPLHVVTTLPGDHTTEVPVDTGIELTFDQDGALDAKSHFAIEPPVKGRFETHGRTLVFVPQALLPETLYTVTLSPGIRVADSDVTLDHEVRLRFETIANVAQSAEAVVDLGRAVIEASPNEAPVVALSAWYPSDEEDEERQPDRLPVEVYRLPDTAAALDAARVLVDAPYWATTSAGLVPTDGLTRTFAGDVVLQRVDGLASAMTLPTPLPVGSYLLVVPREGRDAQTLLQVTDLASYSLVSTTRSLFWVNAVDGGPVADVRVTVAGGATLGRTDARGLLVVSTPRALLPPDDATSLVTITAPDGRTAIVPLGLTARIGEYPTEIHGDVDPRTLERLRGDADRWSPRFARTAHRAVDRTGGLLPVASFASVRAAPVARETFLDDTSGSYGLGNVTDARYWSILSSDRLQYRQDDTVHVWGYVRDRGTLRVPTAIRLRLLVGDSDIGDPLDIPPVAVREVKPGASGAFEAAFELEDVPLGNYMVQLVVDGRPVATKWIDVSVIRKPAYRLDVSLDRRVRIAGQRLKATVTARFYEGTVAPGIALAIDSDDRSVSAVTRVNGTATRRLTVRVPRDSEGLDVRFVSASVAGAEEGAITADTSLLVFPSDRWLTGEAALDGRQLRIRGTVSEVDVARLEREARRADPSWDADPRGAPIARARVTVEVIRRKLIRKVVGEHYDFIAKKVVPEYSWDIREVPVTRRTVRSDGRGRYALTVDVPTARDEYEVKVRTIDSAGRIARTTTYASTPGASVDDEARGRTVLAVRGKPEDAATYRTGETIRMALGDAAKAYPPRANGFLFVTAQQGLRDAVVQGSAQFRHPFKAADAPNLAVLGVRFDGRVFVSDATAANLDTSERTLTISLATDKARYRPGDQATVTVRTTRPNGEPIAATVTLRGVDEKLFTIGAAEEDDPLGQLYTSVGDGLFRSYTSHPLPRAGSGEGGDTGGGGDGDRATFRDTLVFRQLQTGPDGVGRLTLKVADDLTSWHISAAAVTADLRAGVGSVLVPVGLPFFVEATLAPEFVLADQPILRLRGFGSGLERDDRVEFTVRSETLAMAPVTVRADAFKAADVRLPTLTLGDHRLIIRATSRNGKVEDRLVRTFTVLPSRATRTTISYGSLDSPGGIESGSGLTSVILSDAGRGRYLSALEDLAWDDGARLDQALPAVAARELLVSAFGMDPARYPESTFMADAYQHGDAGIALLPYGSANLDLTVRAMLAAPRRFDASALQATMSTVLDDPESTRERKIQALTGEAALGEDVLDAVLAAAASDDLTVREQLHLALAAAAQGDQATAIDLERAVVTAHGERRGPWIRVVDATSKDESVEATSLLALVMVEVGDPLADAAEAYVEANPMLDDLSALQRLAFAERALERAPRAASRFAFTVNGTRTVVALEPGASRTLTLTQPQARTLRLEPLSGRVGVAVSRQLPLDAAQVTADPMLTLKRNVSPAGPVKPGTLVTVDLRLTYGSQALTGCTEVVDQVPSGLAPVGELESWPYDDEEEEAGPSPARDALTPYAVAGQRVAFCAEPDPRRSVILMRYRARVVMPGVYAWEAATAQSAIASEQMSLTRASTVDLR